MAWNEDSMVGWQITALSNAEGLDRTDSEILRSCGCDHEGEGVPEASLLLTLILIMIQLEQVDSKPSAHSQIMWKGRSVGSLK